VGRTFKAKQTTVKEKKKRPRTPKVGRKRKDVYRQIDKKSKGPGLNPKQASKRTEQRIDPALHALVVFN
jgi:hypothetical protein